MSSAAANTDPDELGKMILHVKDRCGLSLRQAADEVFAGEHGELPMLDKDDSMVRLTVAKRMTELHQRAADGDTFAQSLLDHYERHGTFEGVQTEPAEV